SSVRQLCSWQRQRNFVADFVIGRAANDLPFGLAAVVHFANRQAIRVGMSRRSGDLRNDHLFNVRAAGFDVLGLDTRARKSFSDLFRIFWKVDELAQPINRKFHANWRRNRRSFCAKSRMSGMSNKIIASRSMPRPNA